MKTIAYGLFFFALLGGTALAGQCQDDLKKIDRALKSETITPGQKAEVKDMRAQGADLCKAGNEQDGVDVLTEAKAMLNVE